MPRKSFNDENLSRGKNFAKACEILFSGESRRLIGAKLGGVSEGTIRNWEEGKPIANKVLVELERRGISLTWLLTSEGEMRRGDEMGRYNWDLIGKSIQANLKTFRSYASKIHFQKVLKKYKIPKKLWMDWESGKFAPMHPIIDEIAILCQVDLDDFIEKVIPEHEMHMLYDYIDAPGYLDPTKGFPPHAVITSDGVELSKVVKVDPEAQKTIRMCMTAMQSLQKVVSHLQSGEFSEEARQALKTSQEHLGGATDAIEKASVRHKIRHEEA